MPPLRLAWPWERGIRFALNQKPLQFVAVISDSTGRRSSRHFTLDLLKSSPRLALAFLSEPYGRIAGHRP